MFSLHNLVIKPELNLPQTNNLGKVRDDPNYEQIKIYNF